MAGRPLSEQEREAVWPVFHKTMPYDRVMINDGLGLGKKPYTVPSANPDRHYNIFLGPAFRDPIDTSQDWMVKDLVHELVHVWQGVNNGNPLAYVLNSAWYQTCMGGRAYAYDVGLKWGEYNVEQQAHIVEDWYLNRKQTSDPRYKYVSESLWHPDKREGFSKQDLSGILQ